MPAPASSARKLSRQLFRLSLENGALSAERVGGVLAWIERHRPPHPAALLRAYHRLVAAEVARSRAEVEHAGPVSDDILQALGRELSGRYGRPLSLAPRPNPALLAGLRVRVGDDVYEASVAGQLAVLSSAL